MSTVRLPAIALSGLLAVALSACGVATAAPPPQIAAPTAAPTAAAPAPTSAAPAAEPAAQPLVSASGTIAAADEADLSFQLQGVVAEVLAEEGDPVDPGQPLARLDTADLELQVAQARASLAQAQAGLEQLQEGATAEEVRAARAQVAQAAAGLRQAQGSVTGQDIAAAEAQLEQARAALSRLEAGPRGTDAQQGQAAVDSARANLQLQRDSLSAGKTRAELQLQQVGNQLRDAQDAYSRIYWDNRERDSAPGDLPQELIDQEAAALRAVQSLEAQLEQARVGFEQAQLAEREGIAAAQAQLAQAQARYDDLTNGADPDQLAGARAQVAAAQASLDRLRGDQRAGSLQAAQAGVAGAQAQLDRLLADPSAATLAGAIAQVESATVSLRQAERNLEKATLRAPFAGVVAVVGVSPGEVTAGAGPAIRLVDASRLRFEVAVADADVARLRLGQPAEVRVDGLPDQLLGGAVSYIAPTATSSGNARTYLVRIELDAIEGLRAGMRGQVSIWAQEGE